MTLYDYGSQEFYEWYWKVPNFSKLPLRTEVRSSWFRISKYSLMLQLYKGTENNPESLRVDIVLPRVHGQLSTEEANEPLHTIIALECLNTNTNTKRFEPIKEKYFRSEKKNETICECRDFISLEELSKRITMDEIRFSVRMEKRSSYGYEEAILSNVVPLDLKSFKNSNALHDITIRVVNDKGPPTISIVKSHEYSNDETASDSSSIMCTPHNADERVFHGHRLVFAAASSLFLELFQDDGLGKDTEIVVHGVDPNIFALLIEFIYGSPLDPKDVQEAIELIDLSDNLESIKIRQHLFKYLQINLNYQNLWNIWNCAEKYNCGETKTICEKMLKSKPTNILQSDSWFSSDSTVVLNALGVDYLDKPIDEVVFYEAAVGWRNSNIKNADLIKVDDNMDIDTTFAQMLLCIRFPQLEPSFLADVVEKNEAVMKTEGIKELLFEAYRFQACGKNKFTSVRCYPRKRT
ncbi:hypothetical protein CLU79DRAFT_773160 [Phycomyces nitens]|nr:hypothetical protein CLU79DRAFT_773160 [Phycomyces nitens]